MIERLLLRLLWCAVACLWWSQHVSVHVSARSSVSITSPATMSSQAEFTNIDHRPAVFGNPPYGSYLSGVLWFPTNSDSQFGCNGVTKGSDWPSNFPRAGPPVIVMLNRSRSGDPEKCSFVTKVLNAQSIGAAAVVIINYDDVSMPYMGDDGNGELVIIPSVLITHTVGTALVNDMRPTPTPPALSAGGGVGDTSFTRITMQIGWQLPSVNGTVMWQLWTHAYDPKSSTLKSVFGPADAVLHMATSFAPKYYFIRGKDMVEQCDENPETSVCKTSCVKQGQYCVKDPDLDGILTGADVVRENVFQMCLWDRLVNVSGTDPAVTAHMQKNKWWSYVSIADNECDPPAVPPLQQLDTCRQSILLTSLNLTSSLSDLIVPCYNDCLNENEPECGIIEQALTDRDTAGIFYSGTLVINDEAIRGALSCNRPLDTSSCQVLADICQGYTPATRKNVSACVAAPTGCNFGIPKDCGGLCQTSAGTYINGIDDCGLCLARVDRSWNKACTDCSGQVNGPNSLDKCGICKAPNAERDNTCKDCNGVVWGNATKDCAGECGGLAKFDECGACLRFDDRSHWNQSCTDCLGVFRGSAKLDACNKCNGDGKSCASSTTVASSTNWGAVIAIVLAVAGVVGVAIYLYMKRQQNRMREDIDGILKQYLPLQDGNTGSGHIRPTQRLPDHDNL